MQPIQDLALVLRSIIYEERHRIVTALSQEHGLITAIAKNAVQSRRFGGALEPFTASDWIFHSKPGAELYQLTEATVRKSFDRLHETLEKLSLASIFNELLLKLAPQGEACPDLFRLHSNALTALNDLSDPDQETPLLNAYLAKVLQWSGNQPQLQSCLYCPTQLEQLPPHTSLTCIIERAGWVCPSCQQTKTDYIQNRTEADFQQLFIQITQRSFLDFQLSLNLPIRQVHTAIKGSPQEHRQLFKFLEALYIYHVPSFDQKPLKGLRFLGLESNLTLGA